MWKQRCGIVTSHLDVSGTEWGGSVVIRDYLTSNTCEATLIVRTNWAYHHNEGVLGSWSDTELWAVAEHDRSEIKRTSS